MSNTINVLSFIKQATKAQGKLRLAIGGPSGSGKTFSAINTLAHMGCQKILVLDTEHGSAAKYAKEFPVKFDVVDNDYWKSNYDPQRLIEVLKQVGPLYEGVVVDSLTHFWMGPGGMLALVDQFAKKEAARSGGKYDSFGAWKKADPIYNDLVQAILALPCHFAACMRAKSDYEDQIENGKKKKVKVGMAIQMREGFEYEFDVEGMMTMNHDFVVGKTRCRALDEQIIPKPGKNLAEPLLAWLTDGEPVAPPPPEPSPDTERPPQTETGSYAFGTYGAPEIQNRSEKDTLLSEIEIASTDDDLKAFREKVKRAYDDKLITDGDKAEILVAYKKKAENVKLKAAS